MNADAWFQDIMDMQVQARYNIASMPWLNNVLYRMRLPLCLCFCFCCAHHLTVSMLYVMSPPVPHSGIPQFRRIVALPVP